MNKLPKQRMIYSNYDLYEQLSDEQIREMWLENETYTEEEIEELSDNTYWDERYFYDEINWDDAKELLNRVFNNAYKLLVFGSVGLWDGVFKGGFVCDTLDEVLSRCTKDCDYIEFYDKNGHLYLHCTHHDGSCSFEIKALTEQGYDYLNNWEYNWDDKRSESYIYEQLVKRYSRLFRIAEKEWGCPAREYEPIVKENVINHLNKEARSFYC